MFSGLTNVILICISIVEILGPKERQEQYVCSFGFTLHVNDVLIQGTYCSRYILFPVYCIRDADCLESHQRNVAAECGALETRVPFEQVFLSV